uniref:EF-hand domain-containing protein n=1 Tax=Populus davidiana TaxID=266767 RepID=A0A6M2ECK0_9ROSI
MSPWTHHPKNIDKGCLKPLPSASPPSEEQLNKICNRYDTNGDGHLSWEELKSAYSILGMSFPGLRALKALFSSSCSPSPAPPPWTASSSAVDHHPHDRPATTASTSPRPGCFFSSCFSTQIMHEYCKKTTTNPVEYMGN